MRLVLFCGVALVACTEQAAKPQSAPAAHAAVKEATPEQASVRALLPEKEMPVPDGHPAEQPVQADATLAVGKPGELSGIRITNKKNKGFLLCIRPQPGAGPALVVRSKEKYGIGSLVIDSNHMTRDMMLGMCYIARLDLESRKMFPRLPDGCLLIEIVPSRNDQTFYMSTVRIPEF